MNSSKKSKYSLSVDYLYESAKDDERSMTGEIRKKIRSIVLKNKSKFVNEIDETKELYLLLLEWSKTGEVSEENLKKIKEQLFDIVKTVPTLAIFMVPFGSFLLIALIKILPFNILPSSFVEQDDKNI
jgi:hypothetical protein